MLTRVGLRRELCVVFEELFSLNGGEISFHRIADYSPAQTLSRIPGYDFIDGQYTFTDLQRVAKARREIARSLNRELHGHSTDSTLKLTSEPRSEGDEGDPACRAGRVRYSQRSGQSFVCAVPHHYSSVNRIR